MPREIKRQRGRPRGFNTTPEATTIQSLDRALRVLKCVSGADGLSLTEIADQLEESPSTVYRILSTLDVHGMVELQRDSQLWQIGLESFLLGSRFLGRTNLPEQSRPFMRDLMEMSGETANLAIAEGREVIFVSQVETHQPIRAFFRPGTRGPIHASGIGKAILAFLDEAQRQTLLSGWELERFTDRTITDHARLDAALTEIRHQGFAVDDEERTDGMRCIAAPVFNEFGEAIAGISVSGPGVRVTPERVGELGPEVRSAAHAVTRAIGGKPPAGSLSLVG